MSHVTLLPLPPTGAHPTSPPNAGAHTPQPPATDAIRPDLPSLSISPLSDNGQFSKQIALLFSLWKNPGCN
ncbi:hypothetical protein L484_020264 [Morus notabilis]|uniref:Uncharacterized protein n=1 Tax=Morus notabilis TaxID=981085 RepID=W9RY45_9ROSA|nr:hypothetical protein L484_020264 [Morus notabilis]